MYNYEHKQLIESISKLDVVPDDSSAFSDWIKAEAHLEFLRTNAQSDRPVIYASGDYTFVHSLIVPNARLSPVDKDDLLDWSMSTPTCVAGYCHGGGREDVWIERGLSGTGTKTLENALPPIFVRTFEGWTGPGGTYYELHPEYAHLTDIHWRPEKRAYCRFDENGDLEPVVSIATREDKGSNLALVSFKWKPLEEYLSASDASLVRMFDFTLLRHSEFNGWSSESPQTISDSDHLFYHRKVMQGHAAYTRGVQIIRPRRPEQAVFKGMTDGWFGREERKYAEFIAYDWRNRRTAQISTDPNSTVNYFNAEGNSLPYEVSPAFFRPEVLLKYKADRDKYTVSDREVSCRASWVLEGIDVNEAGQVHAYIRYLRRLPFSEQLHWLSFNELPKTNISKRAIINDFNGEFEDFVEPQQRVLSLIRHWDEDNVAWWSLRDEKLLNCVNVPLTDSRDEWAEAFMDLAKLVVEGFETKTIRAKLNAAQIPHNQEDRTIALLEKLLNEDSSGEFQKLIGLRKIQRLRSKAKGHVGGSEAKQLAQDALMEHETFGNHFRFVCAQVAEELETIEKLVSGTSKTQAT